MSDIIRINNLSFRYHNKFVFEKLDLSIRDGEWLAIVGPNGSGKSTLVKIIVGLLKFDGTLIIDNMPLSTYNILHIRKQIGVVFENADDYFIGETVADDLAFALENLAYSPNEIEHMVLDIANTFKINDILDKDPHFLSGGQKQRVALAAALVTNPKILIIDDALAMIDENEKEEILEILDKLHRDRNLTIITITHNLAETYKADRMIVINNGKLIIEGPVKAVLQEDKIFNRIGIEIPFMVDLSIKLQLYGLIDHIILDMNEMVNTLWK